MRPRIAILADVRTWAWARKSWQLMHWLRDEFELSVSYLYDKQPDPIPPGADLYHTYEVFQAARLPEGLPHVTGITAHVWDGHEAKHGREQLLAWMRSARAFHANSVLLVEETRRRYGLVPHYAPNGVDETFFRPLRRKPASGPLVVGWVGKPNPRKGASIVKEACRVAGVELRTVERTHRDALTAEAMRDFYQGLHVVAVASDMDGTPNHALEGAACGCAVVGNRIGNVPELLASGASGVLVERSVESLAAALRELAADVPRAIRMGEAARAEIERAWTWRDLSKNYGAIWRTALAGAPARSNAA